MWRSIEGLKKEDKVEVFAPQQLAKVNQIEDIVNELKVDNSINKNSENKIYTEIKNSDFIDFIKVEPIKEEMNDEEIGEDPLINVRDPLLI